jgi:molybdenum cofactor cytidylyltransferase
MATSLIRGVHALPADVDGVVICLGDMPLIAGRDIDRLIAAFNPLEGRAIIVPVRHGKRGNPILWSRQFFAEMMALAGDQGARKLIEEHADLVAEIEIDNDAIFIDIDTPEALAQLRDRVKPSAA